MSTRRASSGVPAAGLPRLPKPWALALVAWVTLLAACTGMTDGKPWNLEPGAWWLYAARRETVASVNAQREWRRNEAWAPSAEGGRALIRSHGGGSRELLRETASGLERLAWSRLTAAGYRERVEDGVLVVPARAGTGVQWTLPDRTRVLERKVDAYGRLFVIDEVFTMHWSVAATDSEVVTPAGRFRHCLELEGRGEGSFEGDRTVTGSHFTVTERQWHAPGVGLVRVDREEATDGGIIPSGRYHLELIDFGED